MELGGGARGWHYEVELGQSRGVELRGGARG